MWALAVLLIIGRLTLAANKFVWNSQPHQVPQFILNHAPLVYLYSEELYFPGSIEEYLSHFMVSTGSRNLTSPLSLANLTKAGNRLRNIAKDPNAQLYLTAREQWGPEPGPEWLTKWKANQPNLITRKIENAMAVLVVVDKPDLGVIDAFWFYFYPFNLGPFVMGHGPFGNHLGDWEHSLVRFDRNTKQPLIVWMSAHGGGTAYSWKSLLKNDTTGGQRPILFSARGTHAQYTSSGRHPHDIPWHVLSDYTDRGSLWDPSKNFLAYNLNGTTVSPANGSHSAREAEFGDWLLYDGCWGNKKLNKTDARQQWSPFEWRMIDGPTGPLFKNLQRISPCQRSKWWNFAHSCRTHNTITAGGGFDAETSGCNAILDYVPGILRPVFQVITAGGWLCFWIDRLFS